MNIRQVWSSIIMKSSEKHPSTVLLTNASHLSCHQQLQVRSSAYTIPQLHRPKITAPSDQYITSLSSLTDTRCFTRALLPAKVLVQTQHNTTEAGDSLPLLLVAAYSRRWLFRKPLSQYKHYWGLGLEKTFPVLFYFLRTGRTWLIYIC